MIDARVFSVTAALGSLPDHPHLPHRSPLLRNRCYSGSISSARISGSRRRSSVVGGPTLLLLLLAALACGSATGRRSLLALVVLAVAAYGTISAGRAAAFEVVHVPFWEAVTAPRYQYLGLALVTALLCTALAQLAALGTTASRIVLGGTALGMVARIAALALWRFPIEHWNAERAETAAMLASVRQQIAGTPPGQVALIENHPFDVSRGLRVRSPAGPACSLLSSPTTRSTGTPSASWCPRTTGSAPGRRRPTSPRSSLDADPARPVEVESESCGSRRPPPPRPCLRSRRRSARLQLDHRGG